MIILHGRSGVEVRVVAGADPNGFKLITGETDRVGAERVVVDAMFVSGVGLTVFPGLGHQFKNDQSAAHFLLFEVAVIDPVVGAVELHPLAVVKNKLVPVAVFIVVVHILFVGIHVDDGGVGQATVVRVTVATVGAKLDNRRANFLQIIVTIVEEKSVRRDIIAAKFDE